MGETDEVHVPLNEVAGRLEPEVFLLSRVFVILFFHLEDALPQVLKTLSMWWLSTDVENVVKMVLVFLCIKHVHHVVDALVESHSPQLIMVLPSWSPSHFKFLKGVILCIFDQASNYHSCGCATFAHLAVKNES